MKPKTNIDRIPPISQLVGRKLGRVLVKMGKLKRSQVEEALSLQSKEHKLIGEIFVALGYVKQEDVNMALDFQAVKFPQIKQD